MSSTRVLRWSAVLASLFALSAVAAQASWHKRGHDYNRGPDRVLYATTNQNQLISFNARNPDRIRNIQAISGLASGVTLRGIDFRPATGDLYGVGSDSVVYRVNPRTGIAVAEGPAFTPALSGNATRWSRSRRPIARCWSSSTTGTSGWRTSRSGSAYRSARSRRACTTRCAACGARSRSGAGTDDEPNANPRWHGPIASG
jgi:Domain of unknown function (DUF4394)